MLKGETGISGRTLKDWPRKQFAFQKRMTCTMALSKPIYIIKMQPKSSIHCRPVPYIYIVLSLATRMNIFFCTLGISTKKEAVSKVNFAAASYFMECYIFD
jgi:hypothetical protein